MTLKEAEERLTKIEALVQAVLLRIGVVEKKLESVEILKKEVEDTENRQAFHELSVDDKIKDVNSETDSRVVASELRCEEKIKVLGDKFIEALDKVMAIESKVDKLSGDLPTPAEAAEAWSIATNKRNEARKLSRTNTPKPSHA